VSLEFDDMLLNDWGLHHLHLGTTLESDGFMTRTGPVLFVRFTDTIAYLVAILPHGAWTRQELVLILHRNWPEAISRFHLKGLAGVEPQVSDDEVRQLRKAGVLVFLEIEPGVVYAPIGGGYSTLRTSINVVTDYDRIVSSLRRYEDKVRELAPRFEAAARQRGLPVGSSLIFRLRINSGQPVAVEETTKGLIALGPSDV
jgi:hypothetical protein